MFMIFDEYVKQDEESYKKLEKVAINRYDVYQIRAINEIFSEINLYDRFAKITNCIIVKENINTLVEKINENL